MEISIIDRGDCLTNETKVFSERRLLFALSRFDTKIDRVVLTVQDINGPKGGVDKQCQMQILMHRGQDIVITDKNEDVRACIASAADRAGRTVARRLDRQRNRRSHVRMSFEEVL